MRKYSIKQNLPQQRYALSASWKTLVGNIIGIISAICLILFVVKLIDPNWFILAGVRRSLFVFIPFVLLIIRSTVLGRSRYPERWVMIGIIGIIYLFGWDQALRAYPGLGLARPPLFIYSLILAAIILVSLYMLGRSKSNFGLFVKKLLKRVAHVDQLIQTEKQAEIEEEKAKNDRFSEAHQVISRIPVLGWLSRQFVKQGKFYSFALLFCVAILVSANVPFLGQLRGDDEFHLYNVGKGFMETGKCVAWNFLYDSSGYAYPGNCEISALISVFFRIFGVSILSAKLPFLLFSIANIFLIYALVKKICNKHLALILAVFFVTNSFFIFYSNFIRAYSLLITYSLLIFLLLIKIFETKRLIKVIAYSGIIIALLYLGYLGRTTFLTLVPPMFLLIWYRFYLLIFSKVKKVIFFCATALMLLLSTIVLYKLIQKFSTVFRLDGRMDWHTFNLTHFTFNPVLAIVLACLLLTGIVYIWTKHPKSTNRTNQWHRNISILFVTYALAHASYGLFIVQAGMIPRYAIQLVMPNFILILIGLFFVLRLVIQNRNVISIILIICVIFSNYQLWTKHIINDKWSSGYNFVDMYDPNSSTAEGRVKEKNIQAYEIIAGQINSEDKVAFVTDYVIDPQMGYFNKDSGNIDLYCTRYLYYDFFAANCDPVNYDNIAYMPLKEEYLGQIIGQHDKIFFIFAQRKAYKVNTQKTYMTKYQFTKISGNGIDTTGVDVYLLNKTLSAQSAFVVGQYQ